MRRRRSPVPLVVAIVLGLWLGPTGLGLYTDWLWFGETGYRYVYAGILSTQAVLGLVTGALALAILAVNIRLSARELGSTPRVIGTREGAIVLDVSGTRARGLALGAAVLVAAMFALYGSSMWRDWLLFAHGVPFGDVDPVLQRDAGFYVFQLGFLQSILGFLLALIGLSTFVVVAIYGIGGAVGFDRTLRVTDRARRHVAALAAAWLLLLACGAYLQIPHILNSASTIVHGAGAVDVMVQIPALRLLVAAALVGTGLALYQMVSRSLWPLGAAVALYFGVSFGGSATASLVQRFVVAPNEQVRETPFLQHNIAATRKGFALDQVEERELSGDATLSRMDIDANAATLDNVRLWDHQPLLETFSQIQEIRTYYDFVSVHNDRYEIDGRYRQIMLSARELNSASLPNRTWINERLTFTHGYGVALGPVNQVTPEGLPVLFIKDLPPQSSVDLQVEQPAIYFGQLSSDHVFVRTRAREFHYPKGEDNVYSTYDGAGGVPLSNLFYRTLFAARFGSLKVLMSDDITAESRVLFYRRVGERVHRIAPFLRYEPEPYLVISNRRLVWVQDAYTSTSRYPYSSPAHDGTNYIRNSVKITVDAYDGTVTFYAIDERDPIVRTFAAAFPGLFRPLAEMPTDIRTRLRYPEEIFRMQAAMHSTFHMTNPAVFYNKEDQWEVPALDAQGRGQPMQPYYTIMKLPGEPSPEFIQMLPFTPARKDNLAAWMVARSDGDHYGRMMVFQFPKQKVVFGPRQVVGRINQDQAIAPQITLWNQQGSEVLQGTLLIIPIEESLLYIRPLYLRAAGGRIPELKRVIVAYQNQIVMEPTLDEALERLFPIDGRRRSPMPPAGPDAEDVGGAADAVERQLPMAAVEHYRRAIEAQRSGDWGRYGEEIRLLGELLEGAAAKR